MASETDNILALTEMIGSTSPVSDDEGKLVYSPTSAPVHNQAANKRKAPIVIDESFIKNKQEQVAQGKSIIDLAEKIGNSGLSKSLQFNEDLASDNFARTRAIKALNEAIEVLGDDVIDYWAPDSSTKEAAPRLRAILKTFTARMK